MREKYYNLEIGDVQVINGDYYVYLGVKNIVEELRYVDLYQYATNQERDYMGRWLHVTKKNIKTKISNPYKNVTMRIIKSNEVYKEVQLVDIDVKEEVRRILLKMQFTNKNNVSSIGIKEFQELSKQRLRETLENSNLKEFKIGEIIDWRGLDRVYLGINEENLSIEIMNKATEIKGKIALDNFMNQENIKKKGYTDKYHKYAKSSIEDILRRLR